VAGIQVHAVTGIPVEPIRMDGRVVGTVFEDAYSRYCLLGDLRPESSALPRIDQARQTYEMMEAALRLVEMDFSHVLRTWLYLDQILAWYREFNLVRDAFYSERGVFDRVVPASTAVGGSNSAGTAVVANLFAAKAKDQRMRLQNVPSPLQCPALTYGSSFSRAVELILPSHRRLFVSGTASIAPDGSTIHVGNVDAQVAWTMDVVNAILQSRQMGWMDVTRAIGYFKRADDAPAFDRYCLDQGLPPLPAVIAKNDICRDELLFEFEVDAIREVR
jgi:enamine deaminase RidA (YjgF/YER057c/UK114 family)